MRGIKDELVNRDLNHHLGGHVSQNVLVEQQESASLQPGVTYSWGVESISCNKQWCKMRQSPRIKVRKMNHEQTSRLG